eukprot:scaffold19480_cov15-Tisochrysis_lutea.AAC.2
MTGTCSALAFLLPSINGVAAHVPAQHSRLVCHEGSQHGRIILDLSDQVLDCIDRVPCLLPLSGECASPLFLAFIKMFI